MAFKPKSLVSKAVHAGEERRFSPREESARWAPVVGGIAPSIGYVYEDSAQLDSALGGNPDLFVYGRYGNPTVSAFESALVELECHDMPERAEEFFALATASGMAAVNLALASCGVRAGATVAASQDCYGATYALVEGLRTQYGANGLFVDATDLPSVERLLEREGPAALIVETISNPLLKVVDIPRLGSLCRRFNTLLLVDNTFATPMLFRPLANGADVVIHSATKYIGGHGDVLGGVVIARQEMRPAFWEQLKKTGGNLGPHEAWLLHRGLKTMPLRVERQCRNAKRVAEQLRGHPAFARVHYPGLPDHPQHQVAARLFRDGGYGAVIALEIKNAGREEVFRFLEALQMVQPATTVGDLYSLILYPSHASHRALSPEQRAAVGIAEGLVRLAVGVEEADDIVADICAAAEACTTASLPARSPTHSRG